MNKEITVDLFAGGGGASEGIRWTFGRDPDVAINHDRVAIAMHKANHPNTWHLIRDVWEIPPRWATRRRPVGLLWASPDCKHFSKAKGKAPKRNREIRSLAWVVEKWAREVNPRVIILENVEEFKTWGPLNNDGAIIPDHAGDTYRAFIRRIRRLGYKVEHRELRACDYGAPTIRKRLFMIARCDGKSIVWPEPTHGPGLLPYRTAAEIIDWSIPCPSIFERKKPLVENTLRRIAEGIRRYVVETDSPFIVGKTIPFLTEHANASGQRNFNVGDPLRTQCANVKGGHFAVVVPHIPSHLIKMRGTCQHGQAVTAPVPTITAGGNHVGEVRAFLMKYYSSGGQWQELSKPVHTITAKGRLGLVTVMIHGEPYIISDIGMRMLSPRELFRAQGFLDSYQIDIDIDGRRITKADQIRCCGNSVCPPIAYALVASNISSTQSRTSEIKSQTV